MNETEYLVQINLSRNITADINLAQVELKLLTTMIGYQPKDSIVLDEN